MRRPAVLVIVALSLAVAACGDDNVGSQDPATLGSCEQVADAMIGVLDQTLEVVDSMTAEELAELGASEEPPAALVDVQTRGEALVERAGVIGCQDEQMASLLAARADDLSSDSVFGQFLIESIRAGAGSSLFEE